MLVDSQQMKVPIDAHRFSTKEDPRRCSQVLGQRRSLRMLAGSRPNKVLVDACRFSANECARRFSAKEVLMDARRFSTTKVLADACRFSAKDDPHISS
ncbi:hypothetical protein ACOSQ3_021216 [Xanthoceras sorbifolium]